MTQTEVYDDKAVRDARFEALRAGGHTAVFKFSGSRPAEKAFVGLPNYAGRREHSKWPDGRLCRHGRVKRVYVSTFSVSWSD